MTRGILRPIGQTLCNYADDKTIYAYHKSLDNVIARLESDSSIIIQWFADNYLKLNTDKCHLLILGGNSNQQVTVNTGDCHRKYGR